MENFFAWEIIYPVATLALLGALIYGLWQYRHRNRRNDRIADEVVRDRYEHPEKWDK
ncbi:HIG1 domain-containing protein [Aestuariivirga sp.]|uniref:HIG1 domain-containing protein n=1 Tax=Aestuariivirga sp. TaxID=2650926 RepID=UPI00391A195E